MLFGMEIPAYVLVVGGANLLLLLVLQVLVGKRKIKFKGATHMKVHRWLAYATVAFAVVHGIAGLAYVGII